MTRKTNSFTLVEIIAVLLVIAIMAAVAAPKFISIADEARNKVAQAGINEAKATLSVAYAKAYIVENGGTVTADEVMEAAFGATFATGDTKVFGDITVSFTWAAAGASVTLEATDVDGTAPSVTVSDTWAVPSQS